MRTFEALSPSFAAQIRAGRREERCTGTADVVSCVRFAREYELLVSVRGGGHSAGGRAVCEGGLMIDLSRMKGIRIDPVVDDVGIGKAPCQSQPEGQESDRRELCREGLRRGDANLDAGAGVKDALRLTRQ